MVPHGPIDLHGLDFSSLSQAVQLADGDLESIGRLFPSEKRIRPLWGFAPAERRELLSKCLDLGPNTCYEGSKLLLNRALRVGRGGVVVLRAVLRVEVADRL